MITAASGYPQHSGVLIPEIWSGKLLAKFYAATIFGAIANTDYEGEISQQGDKVKIRTIPDIVINDYVKGQPLNVQNPEAGLVELMIDKAKYYNVHIDDIDQFQSDIPFMEKWTNDGSQQMKIVQDRDILANVYADAHSKNKGASAGVISGGINLGAAGAPLALTKSNIVDVLVDIGVVFDEQNVPEEERYVTLPNWAVGLIKKSDLKDASITGDGKSILRNGRVGMVDRLEIFGSNNVKVGTDGADTVFNAIANQKSALTYAAQLVKNETIKAESTFGHLARGLIVYGYKTIKPEAMVHLYIKKG